MASAYALAIFSGMIILNFGVQESLRTFLNPIFTGGVVTANGSCRAAFCESAARRGSSLALSASLRSAALPKGELDSLSQNLTVLTAPSGREPLA